MKYKKIYDHSPIFFQNFMTSVYGKQLIKKRYGVEYNSHLTFLRENFYKIDHKQLQLKKLNHFLKYVCENSEYYRNSNIDEMLPLNDINQLKQLPILTKEDIRKNIDSIITAPKSDLSPSFTGGTTGKSLTVYYRFEDFEKRVAFLDFFKERHGVLKSMKNASFTGKNLIPVNQKKNVYWRFNKPLNQLLFSSFHLSEENCQHYIRALNKFKPHSLDGFPSMMTTLAKYILKNNIELEFHPIAIFPTAESINKYEKEIIEKAFNSKVRNQYASSEGAPFITECEKGNLHLDLMTGVIEKAEENSDISEIYVTSFETSGTPLIRYKIGDLLEFTSEKCNCAYNTPIVKQIIGRNTDFLYSKERGKISSANMSNTIKNLPHSIINIQFVQYKEDEIIINIVVDKSKFNYNHEKELLNEMKIRFGNSMIFKLVYSKEIAVEKSGKYRIIKNNLI